MIVLNESSYFARGFTRRCYIHPNNNDLCIKIPIIEKSSRSRGIIKAIQRENKLYRKLQNKNISWDHLSQYNGDIMTNYGLGSVYQLIKDDDGQISKSLEFYLKDDIFIKNNKAILCAKLDELYAYVQSNIIMTTSILPRNIVVKIANNSFDLIIIDDIGNSEFLPISNLFKSFAYRKIRRKWNRFISKVNICSGTSQ